MRPRCSRISLYAAVLGSLVVAYVQCLALLFLSQSFVRGNPSMVVLYCIILFAVIGGCCFLLWDASTIESSSAGPKPPAKSAKEKD